MFKIYIGCEQIGVQGVRLSARQARRMQFGLVSSFS